MIQSFIAFKCNNQSLQPLLKVEQGFKNSVEIAIFPNIENSISFYLCHKTEKSNKGTLLKIGQKNFNPEIPQTVKIIAAIPSENEFSVTCTDTDGKNISLPEIIKLPGVNVVSKKELPYGTFIYKKVQEITDAEPINI